MKGRNVTFEATSLSFWTICATPTMPPGPSIVIEGVDISLADEDILTESRFQNTSLVYMSDTGIQAATIHAERLQRSDNSRADTRRKNALETNDDEGL